MLDIQYRVSLTYVLSHGVRGSWVRSGEGILCWTSSIACVLAIIYLMEEVGVGRAVVKGFSVGHPVSRVS